MDGADRVYGFSPIVAPPQGQLYVAVSTLESAALAEANRHFIVDLFALAAAAALALLVAWIGTGVVVLRQLNRLLAATEQIAAGSFQG